MAVTSQSGTYGNIPDTLLYTLRFVADFAWGSEEPAFRGMVNLSRAGKLVLEPHWKPGGCCKVQLRGRGEKRPLGIGVFVLNYCFCAAQGVLASCTMHG